MRSAARAIWIFILTLGLCFAFGFRQAVPNERKMVMTSVASQKSEHHTPNASDDGGSSEATKIRDLETRIQHNPKDPLNYFALALIYEGKGEIDKQIKYLKLAIEADSQNPVTHYKLAEAFKAQGDQKAYLDQRAKAEDLIRRLPDVKGTKVVPRNAISGSDYYDQFGNVYSLGSLRSMGAP